MKLTAFVVIGLGFVLLILSAVWTNLFPGTSQWTPEKSQEWSKIKDELHTVGFAVGSPDRVSMHSGPETGQAKQKFDRLKAESDKFAAEFKSAHDGPRTMATIFKWSGISLAAIGIIGWFALRDSG